MSALGRIVGAFLAVVGGYVFISALLDLGVVVVRALPQAHLLKFLVWFFFTGASMRVFAYGLALGLGSRSAFAQRIMSGWRDSSWGGGRSLSIFAVTCGLIVIAYQTAVLIYADESTLFTLQYLASTYIPRLIVGISSVINGIIFWR